MAENENAGQDERQPYIIKDSDWKPVQELTHLQILKQAFDKIGYFYSEKTYPSGYTDILLCHEQVKREIDSFKTIDEIPPNLRARIHLFEFDKNGNWGSY
jgi:hypothetical protein